jgi:hypothetical protein
VGDESPNSIHTEGIIRQDRNLVKPLDRIELSSPLYKSGASPQCFRGRLLLLGSNQRHPD